MSQDDNMKNIDVKIVCPNNEMIHFKYSDLLYFCQQTTSSYISKSKENLEEFLEFRKHYHFFSPYFDFVMMKRKYILLEPLFYKDTYLLAYHDQYFMMLLDGVKDISYHELIREKPLFDFDFLAASDSNICIQENKKKIRNDVGFCLDPEGIVYQNDILQRHLKMARLILNQKMINSTNLSLKYKKYIEENGQNHLLDFLTEELGYSIGFPSNQNVVTYHSKKVTEEQLSYLKSLKVKYKVRFEDTNRKFR